MQTLKDILRKKLEVLWLWFYLIMSLALLVYIIIPITGAFHPGKWANHSIRQEESYEGKVSVRQCICLER